MTWGSMWLTCESEWNSVVDDGSNQWCGLRLSVLVQDRSDTKKSVLVLHILCCETRSCHTCRYKDLEGHSNFSSTSTIYSFSILCLEHHYCGDQQWRSLTKKLNQPSAFVYFQSSWSCYFGLKNLVLFTSLAVTRGANVFMPAFEPFWILTVTLINQNIINCNRLKFIVKQVISFRLSLASWQGRIQRGPGGPHALRVCLILSLRLG